MALQYSNVHGLYRTVVLDTPEDDDGIPNLVPLIGSVEFIPSIDYVHTAEGDILYPAPVVSVLNEGRLSHNSREGIMMPCPTSPGLNPSNWHYTARFRLTTVDGLPVRIPDTKFTPTPGDYALNPFITVPAGQATGVTRGMSAYELAVADGFVGTLTEWLDSLKAPGAGGTSRLQVIPLSAPWPTEAPAGTLVVRVQEGA